MALESVTFISDLVATNPVGATDPKSQGDDHIRNIKSALLTTFPSITGAVTATHTQLNVLAGTTNDRVVRVTGGAVNLGQLTAGMFPNTVVPDAALSSNVPLLNASNTFSASGNSIQTIQTTAASSNLAKLQLNTNSTERGSIGVPLNSNSFFTGGTANALCVRGETAVEIGVGSARKIQVTSSDITLNGVNVTDYARLSQSNTFTATQTSSGSGSRGWLITDGTVSTGVNLSSGTARVGTFSNHGFRIDVNSTARLEINTSGNFDFKAGTVTTNKASASEVGTLGVPRVSKTADYTIAAADAGTELVLTSAADDITVQASGQPAGGTFVFLANGTGGSVDILEGSGMTLTLAGTATTGSRTLAANGRAYIHITGSGTAEVGGIGVA